MLTRVYRLCLVTQDAHTEDSCPHDCRVIQTEASGSSLWAGSNLALGSLHSTLFHFLDGDSTGPTKRGFPAIQLCHLETLNPSSGGPCWSRGLGASRAGPPRCAGARLRLCGAVFALVALTSPHLGHWGRGCESCPPFFTLPTGSSYPPQPLGRSCS